MSIKRRSARRRRGLAMAAACLSAAASARASLDTVTFYPIATNAYGADDTNSCSVSRNNLATIGGYQYTAYYKYNSRSSGTIVVGRRQTNSSTWTLVNTPYTLSNSADSLYSGAIDDHDVVAMAVDGNGSMHLSWGMHNVALNYAISGNVTGATFNPSFTTQTAANNPTLFSQFTSSGIAQVTYPEFYYAPTAGGAPGGDLVFDYRNAASLSGGGSGNGNTYFATYNAASHGFTAPHEVLNGGITSVNGYQNRLAYDSAGNLVMTWTWRSTPNFQTNNNILFAQSPDNGNTWYRQGGATQYTLPIISDTSNGGTAAQAAQVIQAVAQNSSLINQASMTVDKNDNPVIATWLTPNGNASLPASSTNDPNRQYELIYYNGSSWATSQVTHRTSDTFFDTSGTYVRDLGRPIVVVDSSNRVLVITRSEDSAMGTYGATTTPNNNLVVYWNTMAGLNGATPTPWKSFDLDTADMGEYEPSYDPTAWAASNKLDLFYEPVGLTGQTTGTAQVLEWNEAAFNFSSATPGVLRWDADPVTAGVQDGSGVWTLTSPNFSDGSANYAWTAPSSRTAIFGAANGPAGVVTLGANISAVSLTFNPTGGGSYNIAGGGFTLTLAASPTIVVNADATISAPIVTSGTLLKTGVGTLTLSGNNAIAGTVQIGTGAVTGGNGNGAIAVTSAAALGGITTVSLTDNNAAYDVLKLTPATGGITLPPTLTLSLNADNAGPNASGATILESVSGDNVIQGLINYNVGGKGYGIAVDAGTLTFTADQSTTAHTLFLRGAGGGYFTGKVSGSGSIEVDGPGVWTLSGVDTYTGSTTVVGGTLNLPAGASITSTAVNVGGGALNVGGSLATGTALTVNGAVNFLPAAAGVLNRSVGSIVIGSAGVVTLQSAASPNRTVLLTSSLSFNSSGGTLDIGDNDLDLPGASLSTVTGWVVTANLTSGAAASDPNHLTAIGVIRNNQSGAAIFTSANRFDGLIPGAADVLVRFTYFGDANLDGRVDGSDYARIDNGYLTGTTGWFNGDFNYDGAVDGSDYSLIDNGFNRQATGLGPTALLASPAGVAASVPEPAAGLLAVTALAIGRRARRAGRRAESPISPGVATPG